MALDIKVNKKEAGVLAVSLVGSLDSGTYLQLEERVKPFLVDSTKVLIVEMAGLNYISSLGIGALLALKKTVETRKGIFMMTDLQPQIKVTLDIIKALPNVRVFESMEEADAYLLEIQRREIEKQKRRT